VHPSLPVKSVKELIALAKAKPGALNYGSGTIGGSSWLATELFKSMAGVNIVYITYSKGGSGYINDLLSGEIHLGFSTPNTVLPHVKGGKLRALAITSLEPSILYPGLPTVAATGLPGYENVTIDAMWAPAGTPATIISRLNQEIVRILNTAEMKARLLTMGVEADGSSPEQLAAKMKADIAKFGKLIKDAGIKLE
jgi:tripartite-type tricarboxylate transporter receptor subunit TctC